MMTHSFVLLFGALSLLTCDNSGDSAFSVKIADIRHFKDYIEVDFRLEYKGKSVVPVFRPGQVGEVLIQTKSTTDARRFKIVLDRDFVYGKRRFINETLVLRGINPNAIRIEIDIMGAKVSSEVKRK